MPDEAYSFAQARTRLEEIVTQVRKKDVSLETSLDLLEEGVRLASQCTELIDSADWDPLADGEASESGGTVGADGPDESGTTAGAAAAEEPENAAE